MYRTTCPKCGAEDSLYVLSGWFQADGMPLTQDGFSPMDAKQFDTEDENVKCDSCGATCDLRDLDADLDEPTETHYGTKDVPALVDGEPLNDPDARLKAAEAVCRVAGRLVKSEHHVPTSSDGYGHGEVDWVIFYELAEALQRWGGTCADAEGKNPA